MELWQIYQSLTTLECDLLRLVAQKEHRRRIRGSKEARFPVTTSEARSAAAPETYKEFAVELSRLYRTRTTTREVEDYLGRTAQKSLVKKLGMTNREQMVSGWQELILWVGSDLDALLPFGEGLEYERILGQEVAERIGKAAIMLLSYLELFPDHPSCAELSNRLPELLFRWAYASYNQPVGAIPVRLLPIIAELARLEGNLGKPQLKIYSDTLRSIGPYLNRDYVGNNKWLTSALRLDDKVSLFDPLHRIFLVTGQLVADGLEGDQEAFEENARLLNERLEDVPDDDPMLHGVKQLNVYLAIGRAAGCLADSAQGGLQKLYGKSWWEVFQTDELRVEYLRRLHWQDNYSNPLPLFIQAWDALYKGLEICDRIRAITRMPREAAKLIKAVLEIALLSPPGLVSLTPLLEWAEKGREAARLANSQSASRAIEHYRNLLMWLQLASAHRAA